jgi:hypothetical protein
LISFENQFPVLDYDVILSLDFADKFHHSQSRHNVTPPEFSQKQRQIEVIDAKPLHPLGLDGVTGVECNPLIKGALPLRNLHPNPSNPTTGPNAAKAKSWK